MNESTDQNPLNGSIRYYHGGVPGLAPGQTVKSRNKIPKWKGRSPIWRGGQSAEEFGDMGDTVSITTDYAVAHAYAGEYLDPIIGRITGSLYEVEPIGGTEPDPDWPFSANEIRRTSEARIVAVCEQVSPATNPRVMGKAIAPHIRLADGSPFYDQDGYMILSEWRAHGVPSKIIQQLGPWLPTYFLYDEDNKMGIPRSVPPLLNAHDKYRSFFGG